MFFFFFFIIVHVLSRVRYAASVCIEYFIIGATRHAILWIFAACAALLFRYVYTYCFVVIYCSMCDNGLEMGGASAFFPDKSSTRER